jgi:signal transduction histidine kinase
MAGTVPRSPDQRPNVSTQSSRAPDPRQPREPTLERRLFGWTLALTLLPALILLGAGAWAVATALGVAGALGPWEEVAETGRRVVDLAEPAADPALADALAAHRAELSASLTQARRWAFLGDRFLASLPWLVLGVALTLIGLASAASRRLARQLARPIRELVVLAQRMGRGEPLPEPARGTVREVRLLDSALRDAGEKLAEAQERAVTTERLRVWGDMARGVAHEMKNPLTPLRLAAHRLARSASAAAAPGGGVTADAAPPADALAEVAEVIDQEVRRLEELAAQFSALGRPPEGPATAVDIGELVGSLLETDVPPRVDVRVDVQPDLPPVLGHYDGLLRAFRNLIRNGVEALEDVPAPRLIVNIRAVPGASAEATSAGAWIETGIMDNGPGLPTGREDRIFEPDFTTKTRGTGLGLALVRQAIEADGGTVRAGNRRDGGAELVVLLPSVSDHVHVRSEEEE